ncbi:MAG: VPS10 domain-containing protein, partial [Flavobacteriales bacterium]
MRLLLLAFLLLTSAANAQRKQQPKQSTPAATSGAERLQSLHTARIAAGDSPWSEVPARCIGPTVMSGRVVDLDVNPQNAQHFYVAYASGGLWVTHNNGVSFEPVFDNEAVMTIGDIAVDWAYGETIWVGTGEVNSSRSSYSGMGVYRVLPIQQQDGTLRYKAQHKGLPDTHHIGRVVVHPSDPNTIWVASLGPLYTAGGQRGVFKTTDGGATWKQTLQPAEGCGAVDLVIDPMNPNVLYASTWNRSRSAWNFKGEGTGSAVWVSNDGGTTWKTMSHASDGNAAFAGAVPAASVGRIGLALHHTEGAHKLYAFIDNQAHRPDTAVKKVDEGMKKDAFRSMTAEALQALPDSVLERFLRDNRFEKQHTATSIKADVKSGKLKPVALYDYLYDANEDLFNTPIVGAEVYVCNPEKADWKRTHTEYLDDVVFTYGYYFGMIRVSPVDANKIYIAGVPIIKSSDGGATWKGINPGNVHVDHHALWINPNNPNHLINGSDGGVQISYDDGATYVNCNSPAVGQFYTVQVDDAKPYNVYGGLQDNGVWYASSRTKPNEDWRITGRNEFEEIMGGDGMQVMVDTRDNNTLYTGYQFGNYSRVKLRENDYTDLMVRHTLGERPLRWNWQTPILLSKFNQDILYICSNKVHRSTDKGETFTTVSGDLTQGEKPGNVPFGTLTTIDESKLHFGLLAVGSDDGRVHISPDNGYTWNDVSAGLPANLWVTRVQFSSHERNRIYVAMNGYRNDHFLPYIFVSDDRGKTWRSIASNLPLECVNVLREDSKHPDLLYAGTDHGLYVSTNQGTSWNMLSDDLPAVAIHDLVVQEREEDLVIGTHGRSIWILDLEPLREFMRRQNEG